VTAGSRWGVEHESVLIKVHYSTEREKKAMENRMAKVTETMFNAVKLMLRGGATLKECSEYMGISTGTVQVIKVSETFEEYKNNMFLRSRKSKGKWPEKKPEEKEKAPAPEQPAQVVEHRQTVTIQATHFMMEELRKTNELLTLISNKLAFVVDELTGVKTNG
jgi:hypothetical protein